MIYLLHAWLAGTAFLVVLNRFRRGATRQYTDAFLSLVLIGSLLIVFVVFGWKSGLLATILTFVYAGIITPAIK